MWYFTDNKWRVIKKMSNIGYSTDLGKCEETIQEFKLKKKYNEYLPLRYVLLPLSQ